MKEIEALKGKKVAIVAMGASWHDFCLSKTHSAHFDEVWVINSVSGVIFHDRVFMMDPPARFLDTEDASNQTDIMTDVLKKHKGPIYTCELDDRCPGLVEYPIEEVVKKGKTNYLNNTVAYAVAFAYLAEVGELNLYGADFSYKNNLHYAESGRACVEYWLAKCIEQGMKVGVASTSPTLDANVPSEEKLYGYHRLSDPLLVMTDDNGEYKTIKRSEYLKQIKQPVYEPIMVGRHDPSPPEPNVW